MAELITENVARAYEWFNSELQQDPLDCINQMRAARRGEEDDIFGVTNLYKLMAILDSTATRAQVCVRASFESFPLYTPGSLGGKYDIRGWPKGCAGDVAFVYQTDRLVELDVAILKSIDTIVAMRPDMFKYPTVAQ